MSSGTSIPGTRSSCIWPCDILHGVSPARIATCSWSPCRTRLHPCFELAHVVDALGLDELHPAAAFLARRNTRISNGSAKGFSAAPMNICGRPSCISNPLSSRPSSRISFTVWMSRVESISKTLVLLDDHQSAGGHRLDTARCECRRTSPPKGRFEERYGCGRG